MKQELYEKWHGGDIDSQLSRLNTVNMSKLTKCKWDWILGSKHYLRSYVFWFFSCSVIFSVIWFSIYSVLWIRSTRPFWIKKPNTKHLNIGFIWILESMGVWYSNGKVTRLGRPFKYRTFWTLYQGNTFSLTISFVSLVNFQNACKNDVTA